VDHNGAQAAIRAGYSKHTARVIAVENLTKPAIRAAIDARFGDFTDDASRARNAHMERLINIATANIKNYFDDKGQPLSPEAWPAGAAEALAHYEYTVTEKTGSDTSRVRLKMKLHNKVAALAEILDLLTSRGRASP
jgi:phage terminase small subunit